MNVGGTTLQGIPANREGWGGFTSKSSEIDPTNIESASIFKEHGQNIAGVVTEAVQGAGGVFPLQTVSRDSVACAMTMVLCSFLTK